MSSVQLRVCRQFTSGVRTADDATAWVVSVQGCVWLSGTLPIKTLSERLLEKATSGHTLTFLW